MDDSRLRKDINIPGYLAYDPSVLFDATDIDIPVMDYHIQQGCKIRSRNNGAELYIR